MTIEEKQIEEASDMFWNQPIGTSTKEEWDERESLLIKHQAEIRADERKRIKEAVMEKIDKDKDYIDFIPREKILDLLNS